MYVTILSMHTSNGEAGHPLDGYRLVYHRL
jgi:hypothetical protein